MENIRNMVEWNALKQLAFKLKKKGKKKQPTGRVKLSELIVVDVPEIMHGIKSQMQEV